MAKLPPPLKKRAMRLDNAFHVLQHVTCPKALEILDDFRMELALRDRFPDSMEDTGMPCEDTRGSSSSRESGPAAAAESTSDSAGRGSPEAVASADGVSEGIETCYAGEGMATIGAQTELSMPATCVEVPWPGAEPSNHKDGENDELECARRCCYWTIFRLLQVRCHGILRSRRTSAELGGWVDREILPLLEHALQRAGGR